MENLAHSHMFSQKGKRQLVFWLKALRAWFLEARYIVISLAVIGVTVWLAFHVGTSEFEIRVAGLALQLLGIGTVVWGIQETRKLFKRPSLKSFFKNWLKRFPRYKGGAVTAGGVIEMPGSYVRGRVYVSANPNASVESRLKALEDSIMNLHRRIDQTEDKIESESLKQKQALEQEVGVLREKDQEIQAQIEASELGGIHISAMGASWLFVGVILSSIPGELFVWFGR